MTRKQSLADDLEQENELGRRRFVHNTRPKGLLTLEQARELCEQMGAVRRSEGESK